MSSAKEAYWSCKYPRYIRIYLYGFSNPKDFYFPNAYDCEQAIEGLESGDFIMIEGLMDNGQRFRMRRKEPEHGTGNETWEEYAERTWGNDWGKYELDH